MLTKFDAFATMIPNGFLIKTAMILRAAVHGYCCPNGLYILIRLIFRAAVHGYCCPNGL